MATLINTVQPEIQKAPRPSTSLIAASLHASAAAFLELYGYVKATQWSPDVMRSAARHDLLDRIAAKLANCADAVASRAVALGVREGRGRIDRALQPTPAWTADSVRTTYDLVNRFRSLRDVLHSFSHQAALANDDESRATFLDALCATTDCYHAVDRAFEDLQAA